MLSHLEPGLPPPKTERQLSTADVAAEVAAGRALIVVRQPGSLPAVYDVSKWIRLHPGGELAVRHFIGGPLAAVRIRRSPWPPGLQAGTPRTR